MIQTATKIRLKIKTEDPTNTAANRISADFLQLLESQFPITDLRNTLNLRSASDFAQELSIHVNHLNRTVKAINSKSTSVIIRERILAESKRLLEHSDWNVSEIAYALGFTEVTHFNNFFKKALNMNPSQYKKSIGKK
ncbi:helix-turn-helix transcriptional regulator [Algoriphagus halophytocola]|uniref:Helix-turn-helix transcriptional regulator n=1 Tax=Algoriphagus halophytocola TaxID=2991499 RepID=A0ABY6MHZ5_9BACT|nr:MULTISPECIES: helix-turn-helix transcriptional regulator [unclassified Algoriphagus]UZD23089.1 helix-turn-helix transcriptional regulator [Algoriphagus sp. TR-M5]WBL44381.1 helix-turn-helix transcriptional regulator [Algoriphagus sp. TR-M9]